MKQTGKLNCGCQRFVYPMHLNAQAKVVPTYSSELRATDKHVAGKAGSGEPKAALHRHDQKKKRDDRRRSRCLVPVQVPYRQPRESAASEPAPDPNTEEVLP